MYIFHIIVSKLESFFFPEMKDVLLVFDYSYSLCFFHEKKHSKCSLIEIQLSQSKE